MLSRHSTENVPENHAEAPQATVSEGLAQGSYVAARAGVEPITLRTKGVDSTKAQPSPTLLYTVHNSNSTLLQHCSVNMVYNSVGECFKQVLFLMISMCCNVRN